MRQRYGETYLCWTSQARLQAAPLFKNVEPSTENGRAELSCVTMGGAPPRLPADAHTDVPLLVEVDDEVEEVADALTLVSVGAFSVTVAVTVTGVQATSDGSDDAVGDGSDAVAVLATVTLPETFADPSSAARLH
jgi:hypothetical protein